MIVPIQRMLEFSVVQWVSNMQHHKPANITVQAISVLVQFFCLFDMYQLL
jgi:hypothetical protein